MVKTRSYQEEVQNNSSGEIKMLDSLYNGNGPYKTREVHQTYIIYYKKYDDNTYKFISQATNLSAVSLKKYIEEQNGIDLYIDKTNPKNYCFDMPFE